MSKTAADRVGLLPVEPEDGVVFPPDDLDELLNLSRFLAMHTEPGLLLGPDGEQVPLPAAIYEVLVQVAEKMRQGKAIAVLPQGLLLTTQEAANFLGVSRPTLVKLLERGSIPFDKPNRHRRIRLAELVEYQRNRRSERRSILNQLTELDQDGDLYDGTPDDYAQPLRSARRRRATGESA